MESIDGMRMAQWLSLGITLLASALVGHFLARDKGRKVWLWTVICLIPWVNIFGLLFIVGAGNLRIERKLDALLGGTASVPSTPGADDLQ